MWQNTPTKCWRHLERNRFKMRVLLYLLISSLFLAACGTGAIDPYHKFSSDSEVPRISIEDAKKDLDAGTAVMVDSRDEAAFNAEHIAGAVNVPLGSSATTFEKVSKGKKIIVYCS